MCNSKSSLIYFTFLIIHFGCSNNVQERNIKNTINVVSKVSSDTISRNTINQDSFIQAYQQELKSFDDWHKKIGKIQEKLDENIPKMDDDIFKHPFYKHFKGNIGNRPAILDLTISENSISGSLGYDNTFERSEVYMEGSNESNIIILYLPQSTMPTKRVYPISTLRGSFDLNKTTLSGYALNDSTLLPISFEFKENYNAALALDYKLNSQKEVINKIPNSYTLSRHFATPSAPVDLGEFLKAQMLKNIKDKNQYYYPNEQFDGENFKKKLPNFTDFESASSFLTNLHFEIWKKIMTDDYRNSLLNENGEVRTTSRLPMVSDKSSVFFNNGKLLAFDLRTWSMDGESYGDMTSTVVMYDLVTKKEITDNDVFKPNFDRNIIYQSLSNYYDFEKPDSEQSQYYGYSKFKFAYFTDNAIVFCGQGNHGWMYNRYSFPIEDFKPVLKKSFLELYFKTN